MQRHVALALAACLLAGTVGRVALADDSPAQQKPTKKPSSTRPKAEKNDLIVGDPVRFKNLTIFPVTSRLPKNEDRFLTLDEGLKAGTVQVFEVGSQPSVAEQPAARHAPAAAANPANSNPPAASQTARHANRAPRQQARGDDPFGDGSNSAEPNAAQSNRAASNDSPEVNRLVILNKSDKPLYLMPGEIIYGGQQNRTIAVEAIIPPGKTPVAIDVFCVEQGRWEARDNADTAQAITRLSATAQQAPDAKTRAKLAEDAKHGKFVVEAGSLNKAGRAAVQEGKGQSEIWDKVGQANAATAAKTVSSDFTANYTDSKVLKALHAYVDAMQAPVASRGQVVGAIVAVNGSVEAVDVFQSTPLFKKLWPKLLKSDALDAFAAANSRDAKKQATVDDARKFLQTAMQANVAKKSDSTGGLMVTKRDSEHVISFSAGMGGGMGGMGGNFDDAVHGAAYKK